MPLEALDHRGEPFDVLGEPARDVDAVAADIVERQRGVDPGVRVVGHRDTCEDPVQSEPPCVLGEVVEAVRRAMLGVETPTDSGLAHPLRDGVEVVVGEAEPGAHRRRLCEIQHLARGCASTGDVEQLRCHPEQRVGLDGRAVGQPDA